MKKILWWALTLLTAISLTSCVRPYDKPTFCEIESNETAFLIPLFTDIGTSTSDQIKIDSEEFYRQNMVSSKMFQIPHKWIQRGRLPFEGTWENSVKIITVSRTPISGTWEPNTKSAVKLETKESSGLQLPLSYTVRIKAEDCAKYLYNYSPEKSLQEVIDFDLNRYVVGELNKRFHQISYLDIAENKDKIIQEVVQQTKEYFLTKGITVENITPVDGIIYDDNSIQQSINRRVTAQAEQSAKDEELKVLEKQALLDKRKAEVAAEVAITKAEGERQVALKQSDTIRILEQKQNVENSRILAEAQAEALKIAAEKGTSVVGGQATTLVINSDSLQSLGLGELMKR